MRSRCGPHPCMAVPGADVSHDVSFATVGGPPRGLARSMEPSRATPAGMPRFARSAAQFLGVRAGKGPGKGPRGPSSSGR